MMDSLTILGHYLCARRLDAITNRRELLERQFAGLDRLRRALTASPFYRDYLDKPWSEWPILDKANWMTNFDSINTRGIRLRDAEALALAAERDKNFSATLNDVTVGLSTGTSGTRGIFLASKRERMQWAGAILAKLLPRGLRHRERVALVLRADSRLYGTVATSRRIRFGYFDSSRALPALAAELAQFDPTMLVGPPSVLRLLATQTDLAARIHPIRVVCGTEVLDDVDRRFLAAQFHAPIAEVYQATEGFLGASCTHGRIHLNEEYLHIEPQWLDDERKRFVPIVTDLCRHTQPVVRYRLNDVLTVAQAPCACGKASLALERIEGREDDVFWLAGSATRRTVPVFADVLSRALVTQSIAIDDYEIVQVARDAWRAALHPLPSREACDALRTRLIECATRAGGMVPSIEFVPLAAPSVGSKRRRVRRECRVESSDA